MSGVMLEGELTTSRFFHALSATGVDYADVTGANAASALEVMPEDEPMAKQRSAPPRPQHNKEDGSR